MSKKKKKKDEKNKVKKNKYEKFSKVGKEDTKIKNAVADKNTRMEAEKSLRDAQFNFSGGKYFKESKEDRGGKEIKWKGK